MRQCFVDSVSTAAALRLCCGCCFLSTFFVCLVLGDSIIVTTKYGRVRGTRLRKNFGLGSDALSETFDRFLGIPYARPPVGKLRFMAPEPPEAWHRVLDATKHRNVCPQLPFHMDTQPNNQNEDCLFLNVYSPYKRDDPLARYPVMVYFHGGSYEVGSGKSYDGSVLSEIGVVVVTINYRLGALGFLSSGDSLLPGNYGLLDQAMTLKWVNQNIAQFRGNSSRVTLFGQSVGASSVGLMMLLPATRELFHGVISQSGVATAPYTAHHKNSTNFNDYVHEVGELFNCSNDNLTAVIDCLRNVETTEFIEHRGNFPLYDPIDPEFRPFIDGKVLSDVPSLLFRMGQFKRVPIIIGTVKDEFGNYFSGGARYRKEFDEALDNYLIKILNYNPTMLNVVKFQYTDWSEDEATFEYKRGDLLSDMHMIAPTIEMADILSEYVNVYQYHFSLSNCYHSIELNYVFGTPFSGHFADEMTINGSIDDFTPEDRNFSLDIMKLWTNFAKFGRPFTQQHEWLRYNRLDRSYLSLSAEGGITMKQHLRADKVAFWNDLMPMLLLDSIGSNRTTGVHPTSFAVRHLTPVAQPLLQKPTVNLWILLASIVVLLVVILLLTALLVRITIENRRFKRSSTIYITKQI